MPWEDLFVYLGFGGLFMLVLVPLWKGDDAISETFGQDVKRWILDWDFNQPLDALTQIRGVYIRFFGDTYLSAKSILIALFFPILGLLVGLVSIVTSFEINLTGKDVFNLSILCLFSTVAGLCSLSWTRFVILLIRTDTTVFWIAIILVADVLLAASLCLFALTSAVVVEGFISGSFEEPIFHSVTSAIGFFYLFAKQFLLEGAAEVGFIKTERSPEVLIATQSIFFWVGCFFYSLSIWVTCISCAVARWWMSFRSLHALATYVLPFDEKPIRACAILIYLSALSLAALIWILEKIIQLIT